MGSQQENPCCSSGAASAAAATAFWEGKKVFAWCFWRNWGENLLWLCIYWGMKGLLQVLPPPLSSGLSSVPFSFGSDMEDHFITPCGACRQVMREVTARVGLRGSFPDLRHHPLNPRHLPLKRLEVPRRVQLPSSAPGLAPGSSNCIICWEGGSPTLGGCSVGIH